MSEEDGTLWPLEYIRARLGIYKHGIPFGLKREARRPGVLTYQPGPLASVDDDLEIKPNELLQA
jgi:hypothetical protein